MKATQRVLKAISLMGSMQVVTMLCSIVRTKFVAWWIGPVGVGLFGIFNSVLDMMGSATQLNLRHSAVRDIAAASESDLPKVAGAVRWWSLRLGICGSLLMMCLSPLLSLVSFGNTSMWWAFAALAVALAMLSVTNGEQALLQGTGNLSRLARAVTLGAVIGTVVSIPMFYFWSVQSIIPSLLAFATATLVCMVTAKQVKSNAAHWRQHWQRGKSFLSLGAYLTVSAVASTAASYTFLSYLNNTASTTVAGIYQAGYTLVVKYAGLIFSAVALEFYPRMVKVADRPRMASTVISHELIIILAVLAPLSAVYAFIAPWVVQLLYSSEFLDCTPIVVIGTGGIVLRAISICFAYVVIARGDGCTYVSVEIASALLGLALNIVGYNLWGYAGLGTSYLAWYAAYCLMTGSICRLRYGMRLRPIAWIACIGAIALVSAAIVLAC